MQLEGHQYIESFTNSAAKKTTTTNYTFQTSSKYRVLSLHSGGSNIILRCIRNFNSEGSSHSESFTALSLITEHWWGFALFLQRFPSFKLMLTSVLLVFELFFLRI